MRLQSLFFLFVFVFVTVSDGFSQGLHDRIVKRKAEAEAKPIDGVVSFAVGRPYQETFDLVVNQLKKEGFTIEKANLVTGQVTTPIEKSKGGKDSNVQVTLIREGDSSIVKVAVLEYSKNLYSKALFGNGPYSSSKANQENTKELAELLKSTLNGATASSPN